jgi:hypothetical protein
VIEKSRFAPSEEGTPQGGVVSPMLLNIALHGMEEAAGVRYTRRDPQGAHVARDSPVLVRYADDFVVMCHTRDQAEQVWHRLAGSVSKAPRPSDPAGQCSTAAPSKCPPMRATVTPGRGSMRSSKT